MRPQYFMFEWLLMTAYLYYIKWYNLLFVISYFGSARSSKAAVGHVLSGAQPGIAAAVAT